MAFIDTGDQFVALAEGRRRAGDEGRHFGLVVDDKAAARRALESARAIAGAAGGGGLVTTVEALARLLDALFKGRLFSQHQTLRQP